MNKFFLEQSSKQANSAKYCANIANYYGNVLMKKYSQNEHFNQEIANANKAAKKCEEAARHVRQIAERIPEDEVNIILSEFACEIGRAHV